MEIRDWLKQNVTEDMKIYPEAGRRKENKKLIKQQERWIVRKKKSQQRHMKENIEREG